MISLSRRLMITQGVNISVFNLHFIQFLTSTTSQPVCVRSFACVEPGPPLRCGRLRDDPLLSIAVAQHVTTLANTSTASPVMPIYIRRPGDHLRSTLPLWRYTGRKVYFGMIQ